MQAPRQPHDSPSLILDSIGFFNPLIGLLIYFALKGGSPYKAGSVLRASAWGALAVPAIFLLIFAIAWIAQLLGLA